MAANTHVPSTAILTNQLPFWRQLRWQLILYFIVLAIGAVVVVTTFTLIQVRNQSTQQAFRQLESVAELKENQIEQWLQNADIALNVMSANLIGTDDVVSLSENRALSPDERDRLNKALRERVEAQVQADTSDRR